MKISLKIFGIIVFLTSFNLLSPKLTAQTTIEPLDRPDFFRRGDRLFEREIRRLQRTPPPDVLTVSYNENVPLGWQILTFKEAGFTIQTPVGFFDWETDILSTTKGDIEFKSFTYNFQNEQYSVAYSEVLNLEPILETVRDSIVNGITWKQISEKTIDFNNYSGKELIFSQGDRISTVRIYLIDNRFYILAAKIPDNPEERLKIARFFNSFQLLNRSQARH